MASEIVTNGCKSLLAQAKKALPTNSQVDQIKCAISKWFLDELGEEDAETRKQVTLAFLDTPGWFGGSANAMQQLDDYVKKEQKKREIVLPEGF